MQYIGEQLLPGILGKAFTWLSMLTLLASIVTYYISITRNRGNLIKLARSLYLVHYAALLMVMGYLYKIIFNHNFEYAYVWQYSARDLPFKFLLSCFWAGQEGSFLIWAFFQGTLGIFILGGKSSWKNRVMPVYSTAQVFILSMVLGLKIGGIQIGGSPFNLLRDLPQNAGLDLFREPNYLQMIMDGNGLNPLLENIWMIIHPPALFMGYAVTMVPFSFAVASIWKKDYHGWLRDGIRWTLAALLFLGIGILLGGRWAYESLTFGGFWAWDPVENASLVPWLFLLASLHLMLITYKRQHSYLTTYVFTFLGWVFVVYATYLTRSGVLGSTSVHSFGESVLSLQMIIFNLLYLLVPLYMLFLKRKEMFRQGSDEILTREFWMLIGSIIVVLSAFQVTLTTSIPVINKLLGTNVAPPTDSVSYYNRWQLPFAVAVGILIAVSQYLWYGKNDLKPFLKKLLYAIVVSILITAIIAFADHVGRIDYLFMTFAFALSAVVSLDFLIRYFTKMSNYGASITHAGFSIFILGVIIAFSNSQIISRNTSGINLGGEQDNQENLALVRNVPQPMGEYLVTYSNATEKGKEIFYTIDFVKKSDSATGKIAFSVYPSVNRNTRMGYVYNPDTKHLFDKDIFNYITFAQQRDGKADSTGFIMSGTEEMNIKDTAVYSGTYIIMDTVIADVKDKEMNNASIEAFFSILNMKAGRKLNATIKYQLVNGELKTEDALIDPLDMKLRFEGFSSDSRAIKVGILEKKEDFIVIRTVIFPFMNLLWFGTFVMFAGFVYSIYRRMGKKKEEAANGKSSQ